MQSPTKEREVNLHIRRKFVKKKIYHDEKACKDNPETHTNDFTEARYDLGTDEIVYDGRFSGHFLTIFLFSFRSNLTRFSSKICTNLSTNPSSS